MFKFRSGTNGLNEELGRHRGRNDDRQCKLCGEECESVVHVLWECPVYDTIRSTFMGKLKNLLGGSFEEFSALDNVEKTGFVLGCENWNRSNFKALLSLVKNFVLSVWVLGKMNCMVVRMVRHQVALVKFRPSGNIS